jgi:hypothetical protein
MNLGLLFFVAFGVFPLGWGVYMLQAGKPAQRERQRFAAWCFVAFGLFLAVLVPLAIVVVPANFWQAHAEQAVGTLLSLLGGGLCAVAVRVAMRLRVGLVKARGTVSNVYESSGPHVSDIGHHLKRFNVTFRTASGKTIEVKSGWRSRTTPDEGTAVDVYYDPKDPASAMIGTFWEQYGVVCFLLFFGLPLSVIGLMFLLGRA